MTVSANASLNYQRDQLITMACRLAGVWPSSQDASDAQSADDVSMAADFMNLELKALQAEGTGLRFVERTTLALVASQAEYSLASTTIDVEIGPNDQAGTIINSSGQETVVTAMSAADYLDITDKTTAVTDVPTRVYIDNGGETLTAVFWPVPDATSVTWRYQRVRLVTDMDSGSVTLDLQRRWMQYVAYAVASQVALAKSIALDKVNYLRQQADAMKERCKATDNERPKARFRMAHKGRHW